MNESIIATVTKSNKPPAAIHSNIVSPPSIEAPLSLDKRNHHSNRHEGQQAASRKPQQYRITSIH
jgi:hypothetical protein